MTKEDLEYKLAMELKSALSVPLLRDFLRDNNELAIAERAGDEFSTLPSAGIAAAKSLLMELTYNSSPVRTFEVSAGEGVGVLLDAIEAYLHGFAKTYTDNYQNAKELAALNAVTKQLGAEFVLWKQGDEYRISRK